LKRSTRQRDAIRAVIAAARRPLAAQEIMEAAQAEIPSLGLATVYRTLNLLLEAGELRSVDLPGENPRYESAELEHHHHFQCTRCERVFDIPECTDRIDRLAPRGFRVEHHELTLYGHCDECAAKSKRGHA
jgi:Fur family ferric uptake transcriptional regulator